MNKTDRDQTIWSLPAVALCQAGEHAGAPVPEVTESEPTTASQFFPVTELSPVKTGRATATAGDRQAAAATQSRSTNFSVYELRSYLPRSFTVVLKTKQNKNSQTSIPSTDTAIDHLQMVESETARGGNPSLGSRQVLRMIRPDLGSGTSPPCCRLCGLGLLTLGLLYYL